MKLVRLYGRDDAVAVDDPTLNDPETDADEAGQSLEIHIDAGLTLDLSNLLPEWARHCHESDEMDQISTSNSNYIIISLNKSRCSGTSTTDGRV